MLSLLMAASAAASGLLLLYLARPFISEVAGPHASQAPIILFSGAGVAGAAAAVAGLVVGLRLAGRIRVIVRKAEAFSPRESGPVQKVADELGALDAAVGRLTLSMDKFVRDSDILARLPEGMLLLQPTGELQSFNATAEILLGLSLERFRGISILSPGGVFPLHRGNEALAELLTGAAAARHSVHMSDVKATTANAQSLVMEMTVQHRDFDADSTALVLLFRGSSEKQRIRDEIRRADQLAMLGGMSARVAHEIRTPLATIRGLLELLHSDPPGGGSSREYMDRIIAAVDRQDRLVEDLLTLSHPEPETCQPVAIPELIEDVVGMLPADPRVSVRGTGGTPPPVWGDAFRLSEVFTNLIQNALDATPTTGVVDVRIEPYVKDRLRVSVRNTGTGLSPDLKERIFQPFFTTKARGTGLGLAIARQIVDAHHGSLDVTSDGLSETTFVVDLPTGARGAAEAS
jgi:signal transduction histidine kinase/HAMP domain-containing protein